MVLLWKLGAGKEKPQHISKNEWHQGCTDLQVESIDQFKALLPSLDPGFLERYDFKSFYNVCLIHSTLFQFFIFIVVSHFAFDMYLPIYTMYSFVLSLVDKENILLWIRNSS